MAELRDRERIIETARDRFFQSGISKVTVDELAEELGMSKKTVYKFFPSKDDILKGVVRFMMKFIERKVEAIVESDRPFEQKMTDLLSLIGSLMSKISLQFQKDLQRFAPGLWKEMEDFRREHLFTKIEKMFIQAKQEGVFRSDVDHALFMLVFLHSMQGIMNPKTLSENAFSPEIAFKAIFKILFEGVLTDDTRVRFHFFEPTYSKQL
ncbi:MAG TPA: TetR/AcrR family transcriptional regulator [Bacteroidota bacterium]|nr:TetR/AcrR family transcriptional regulator [Bacteroidota bacterium]